MLETVMNQYEPDRVSPPGETLLESIQALGMSQAELAERLGRPKKTVNEIIQAKAAITPETALQLESVLGVPAAFWMSLEANYREHLARKREEQQLADAVAWGRRFPYRAMARLGWVSDRPPGPARVREILRFFGVASPAVWEDTWSHLEVAFRRSAKLNGDRHAIAAWLRRGEVQGHAMECAPYNADRFRAVLGQCRTLTVAEPEVFQPEVTRLCSTAGVAVAWVPEIPRAPVSGATRWLGPEKALIQVSLRYKSDDQLWFSIFHEAAHVLKHSRKAVFIEDGDAPTEQEHEADLFAASLLIPPADFASLMAKHPLSTSAIEAFAREIGIAPGIVVGRLQHEKSLPYDRGNQLKRRLDWSDS